MSQSAESSLENDTPGGTPPSRETVAIPPQVLFAPDRRVNDSELHMELDPAPAAPGRRERNSTIVWPNTAPSSLELVAHPRVPEFETPVEFGAYDLLGEVGRGGMGVVYKARHKELDRLVAIKMILASHLATPEQVERFYSEARAAARIRSANIVGIHDVGQIQGQHYFAMDFVAGPSLGELIRGEEVSVERAAHLVQTVARAVAELHDQGIIHRDLKPSNVLLDENGRPCVTDFGLAKFLETNGRVTRSGAIVGTPGYMAPEQAAGKAAEVGPASDVYSLGAILYELLTGRPPFSGETPLDTLVQVLEGEPPSPRRIRPEVPKVLERICLKCLERQAADRYANARDLADDLDRYLRDEQTEATQLGIWQRLRRWARREPALVTRLGTMALCGAIIESHNFFIQRLPERPYQQSILLVILWALVSMACQQILNRDRWADTARYVWAAADVLVFTLLVLVTNGLATSLVAGYFLLVAASGLWFREHLVWITTALAVVGYGLLVLVSGIQQNVLDSPYRHVVFATALAVSGLITGYQVRRVRALSRYYDSRPLP